jgi:hypothetical protein
MRSTIENRTDRYVLGINQDRNVVVGTNRVVGLRLAPLAPVRPAFKPARKRAEKCRPSSRCFKRLSCAAMRAERAAASAAMHQCWQRLHQRPAGRLTRS